MKYLLLCALTLASPAVAQQNCAPYEMVHERLTEGYKESVQTIGLSQGTVVQQYANSETGTWTITVTRPDGVSCVVASGQSWESVGDISQPQGEPL